MLSKMSKISLMCNEKYFDRKNVLVLSSNNCKLSHKNNGLNGCSIVRKSLNLFGHNCPTG